MPRDRRYNIVMSMPKNMARGLYRLITLHATHIKQIQVSRVGTGAEIPTGWIHVKVEALVRVTRSLVCQQRRLGITQIPTQNPIILATRREQVCSIV